MTEAPNRLNTKERNTPRTWSALRMGCAARDSSTPAPGFVFSGEQRPVQVRPDPPARVPSSTTRTLCRYDPNNPAGTVFAVIARKHQFISSIAKYGSTVAAEQEHGKPMAKPSAGARTTSNCWRQKRQMQQNSESALFPASETPHSRHAFGLAFGVSELIPSRQRLEHHSRGSPLRVQRTEPSNCARLSRAFVTQIPRSLRSFWLCSLLSFMRDTHVESRQTVVTFVVTVRANEYIQPHPRTLRLKR
jgi:hypothetical protein